MIHINFLIISPIFMKRPKITTLGNDSDGKRSISREVVSSVAVTSRLLCKYKLSWLTFQNC